MSRPLVKNEKIRFFLAGMLVMCIIFYWIWKLYLKIDQTQTRSLPVQVACSQNQKPFTSVLTEDKLVSEPIKKGETETVRGTQTAQTGGGTQTEWRTPPPFISTDGSNGSEEIYEDEVVGIPEEVEVTYEGRQSGIVSNNGPVTERDADIVSTVITPDQDSFSENGVLNIRVPRKIKYE